MNFMGLIVGAMSFIIIGVFHPIVIKCEYYFSAKGWFPANPKRMKAKPEDKASDAKNGSDEGKES